MNLKHPALWALFTSLGAVLLGAYAFWGATHFTSTLPPTLVFDIGMLSFGLAAFGVLGSVASLIWLLVAAAVSKARSRQTQKPGRKAFLASRLAGNPFVMGLLLSLFLMGLGYLCLRLQGFFHGLIARSSYGSLADTFTFLFYPLSALIYLGGKLSSIVMLVVTAIYLIAIRFKSTRT
jgi:hypothetical protein